MMRGLLVGAAVSAGLWVIVFSEADGRT